MHDILSSLNEKQRQVATHAHGPLLVLAGAGSGKTRALTHRIAYLLGQGIAYPQEILAVTFTNKAARQMKERTQSLLPSHIAPPRTIGTFHGLGARILREQHKAHSRSATFVILDSKDSEALVRQALSEANVPLREWSPRAVRQQISKAKSDRISPEDILAGAEGSADEIFGHAYARYERMLARNDAYDFDDLLVAPVALLEANNEIRDQYRRTWRFLSVDEYQDTNALQETLLSLLLGPEKNLCVVGDDYQAIYSWRGARVDHILRFESQYPGCTTIYLTQNYRSTPQILTAANTVIAANVDQKHKELWTDKGDGNNVELAALQTDRDEARFVCDRIEALRDMGIPLTSVVVLYRTNAQSRLFEEQFLTRRIPYTIVGGFRFYDRREVKDAIAFLQFFSNPNARFALGRISDAILHRIGPKTIDSWERAAIEQGISLRTHITNQAQTRPQLTPLKKAFVLADAKAQEGVAPLLRALLHTSGYISWLSELPDGQERHENIEELINVASGYADVHSFLEDVALLSDIDTFEGTQNRVTCMTLHAAKGLEFPTVFIVGCEEGLLPHSNSFDSSAALEEERRLLYVGMTRAQEHLTLTYARHRFRGGEMNPQIASRFLTQLPEHVVEIQTPHQEIQHSSDAGSDILFGMLQPTHTTASSEPVTLTVSEGEFVTHPQFGRGVVISISGSLLTCVFEQHGVKTFDSEIIAHQL